MVTFSVASGEQFVPRLFAELTLPIRSVSVARPSLDDVFMSYTGRTIRDSEATVSDKNRAHVMAAALPLPLALPLSRESSFWPWPASRMCPMIPFCY
jgi:hypothetical protein